MLLTTLWKGRDGGPRREGRIIARAKRRATRKQSLGRIYGCSFLLFPQLARLSFSRIHVRPPLSVRQMVRPRFCFKARANNRRITRTKRLDDRFFEKKKKRRVVKNGGSGRDRNGDPPWFQEVLDRITSSCRQHVPHVQTEKELLSRE